MTQSAGYVLGRMKGGKTATGTVPGGARDAAAGLALGGSPPPGEPGWGTFGGAIPGGGTTLMIGGSSPTLLTVILMKYFRKIICSKESEPRYANVCQL